jgi:copper chaperone
MNPTDTFPTLDFHLPEMSCGHCVRAVTAAVQALDAQAQMQFDLPARRVQVHTGLGRERLAAALVEAGYTPA